MAIVNRLKSKTTAHIALISLSPVGEELESNNLVQNELNLLFRQYNQIIQDVAQKEGVAYIPFYEHFCAEMQAAVIGKVFCDFSFLSFYRDAFRHFCLHQSFEQIANVNGWVFHTDGIHLNRRGGMILADLVQAFLDVR